MARTQPTSPGRTFPRWSVPLDKIRHQGTPKEIYEALAAGREDNWGAVASRILRYSMRLADRGFIAREASWGCEWGWTPSTSGGSMPPPPSLPRSLPASA
jgi:hypothetical protein